MVNPMLKATELAKYASKKGYKTSITVESIDKVERITVEVKKVHKLRLAA